MRPTRRVARRSCSISITEPAGRRCVFITLHGIAAFLGGGLLALIGVIAAAVQFAIAKRRPRLAAHLPMVLRGSVGSIVVGAYFVAAAEFQWIDGAALDDWILPVMIASLIAIMATHVMWLRRGGENQPPESPSSGG